jgi:NitT/TauT family transport system substrate-binding protein
MLRRKSGTAAINALTLAAVVLAGCGSSSSGGSASGSQGPSGGSSASVTKVRFTIFPAAFPSLGVYIADAMGYFKQEGVQPDYVNAPTGSSALQVMSSGQTDFIISGYTDLALARKESGLDGVLVAGQFKSFDAALDCRPGTVLAGQGYPGAMSTIATKTVGITSPGSATDTYLRYSLIAAGATPDDHNIIAAGGVPNLLSAFQASRVDCVTAYEPMQITLDKGAVQTVLNWGTNQGPPLLHNYIFNGIATTAKYSAAHPSIVKAVSLAMKRAVAFGSDPANAPAIAKATLKFFPGLSEQALETAVRNTAPTFGYTITPAAGANALKVYNTVHADQKVNYPYSSFIAPPVRALLAGNG